MTSTLTATIVSGAYTPLSGSLNIPLSVSSSGTSFAPNNTTGLIYSNLTVQPGFLYEITISGLSFSSIDLAAKLTLTVNTQPKQTVLPSQSPFTSSAPTRFIPTDLNGAAIFLQFTGSQSINITAGTITIVAIPLRDTGSELRKLLRMLLCFILQNLTRNQRRKLRSTLCSVLKCISPEELVTLSEEIVDLVSEENMTATHQ